MHMGNSLNVAHLYDVYEDDSCVDLIMEKCRGGDLWTRIRKGDYSEEGVSAPTALAVRQCCKDVSVVQNCSCMSLKCYLGFKRVANPVMSQHTLPVTISTS